MYLPGPAHMSTPKPTHRAVIVTLSAAVALVLTALLYGDTLALPLFSDDLVQIPWLESISWRELWTSPSPYGYYRPVWYSLWRLWGMLTGGLQPAGLHLLNVAAHFAASLLTGLLAAAWIRPADRNQSQPWAACTATALFAIFPFARQAVAWPGAVYNPLVSAMAAGALLAYDRGRRLERRGPIVAALLLSAVAALTYEAGLLVGPLVVLAEVIGWLSRRWTRPRTAWPLVFVALFVVATVIWRAMRGAGATGFGLNSTDLRRNVSFLGQSLTYPVAPLAHRLASWRNLDPETALWLVAAPVVILLAWLAWRHRRSALLLGAGWFALFALPPLVSMQADWFALAPRFLYMTATGVSLVWTAAAAAWCAQGGRWRQVALTLLLAGLLMPATLFVRQGVDLYALAGESIWDAVAAAQRGTPVLLVNLPQRITPDNRTYPLGFEGVTPLPARVQPAEIILTHTGIPDGAKAVSFGVVAPAQPAGYTYQLYGEPVDWVTLVDAIAQAESVYLTQYEPERITLEEAGGTGEDPSSGEPVATFGRQVQLLAAEAKCDESDGIRLLITWRLTEPSPADATVFAHLLDGQGTLVAQADGYPLLGMVPFWMWEPGPTLRDVRTFSAPAGTYTIRLGVWEPATGERWEAAGHPDSLVLLPVTCP